MVTIISRQDMGFVAGRPDALWLYHSCRNFHTRGTVMDWIKVHLALNHVSVIGMPFLFLLLTWGILRRSDLIQRLAVSWIALFSVIAIALKFTGDFAAEHAGQKLDPVRAYVNAHEKSADQATTAVFVVGLLAAIGVYLSRAARPMPRWSLALIFIATFLSCILLARTAHVGGQISHPELR